VRSIFLLSSDGLHGHSEVITSADLLEAMSRGGESQKVYQMTVITNHLCAQHRFNLSPTLQAYPDHKKPLEYELTGYLATTIWL